VTLPKDSGGLGLRRLDTMNKACIGKLGWSLYSGASDFWCQVMRGKYFRNGCGENIGARTMDSSLWKAIVNLWPNFKDNSFWSLGDGKKVDAWDNAWIDNGIIIANLNVQIPSELIGCKVADLVDANGMWKWNLFHNWLPTDVQRRIEAIMPPKGNICDEVCFNATGSYNGFCVAAMYAFLSNAPQENVASKWRQVWRLKVPERVRYFIWLLNHDRLLTNYNKSRMRLGSAMCGFCGNIIENSLHVLRDCPLVMPMWLNVVPVNMRDRFFIGDLNHWIAFNMRNEAGWMLEVDWKDFWAMACHCLWYWRNKEVHEANFVRPTNPYQFVRKRIRDYQLAMQASKVILEMPRSVVLVGWKPPAEGWVKLNTDGACSNNGVAGCGGIIKGCDGEWLGGFAKSIGMCSAYIAEL